MKTPDGPIVPLGDEDAVFPDEVKEVLTHEDLMEELRREQQKRDWIKGNKEVKK